MHTAETIIAECHRRGVQLTVLGREIRYRAGREPMTRQLLEAIRRRKPEIIARLNRSADIPDAPDSGGISPVAERSTQRHSFNGKLPQVVSGDGFPGKATHKRPLNIPDIPDIPSEEKRDAHRGIIAGTHECGGDEIKFPVCEVSQRLRGDIGDISSSLCHDESCGRNVTGDMALKTGDTGDIQPHSAPPWPPRDPRLARWPDPWRAEWGRRANALIDAGEPWQAAEARAFAEVLERIDRGETPPPYPVQADPSSPGGSAS